LEIRTAPRGTLGGGGSVPYNRAVDEKWGVGTDLSAAVSVV
jgi:hypothetical protein